MDMRNYTMKEIFEHKNTLRGLIKMADIVLPSVILECIFERVICPLICPLITITLKRLPNGAVDSKSALIWLMVILYAYIIAHHSFENKFLYLISFLWKWIQSKHIQITGSRNTGRWHIHLQHCKHQTISVTEVRTIFQSQNSTTLRVSMLFKIHHIAEYCSFHDYILQ